MKDTPKLPSLHRERLESLGLLAGSVAHDFNNILTGVLGHVSYLMLTLPENGPHSESLKAIEEGARRAASMTQQILNFSKTDGDDHREEVNLGKCIVGTCNLLKGAFTKQFKFECDIPHEQLWVMSTDAHIAQLIINLVVNARESLTKNGEIRLNLSHVEIGKDFNPCMNPKGNLLEQGHYAQIVVVDNGSGISKEVMGRVFEPYFSTKQGKGTGLGLATVDSIVQSCNGGIDISSQVGVGTRISVFVPLCSAKSDSITQKATKPKGGRERILVVDDEDPVRNVICLSLQRLGYDVEIADSGHEALRKFKESRGNFDLVILDMIMPELSGEEVFGRLWDLKPGVRVLISTAYASENTLQAILNNGGTGFLQKPFSVEELAKTVRECLDK